MDSDPMPHADITARIALRPAASSGPFSILAEKLAELAEAEINFSDHIVRVFGQSAYEVVRECRCVATMAAQHSSQLRSKVG